MRELYDTDVAVIAKKKGLKKDHDMTGKMVEITTPEQPPVIGEVVEAYEDALGVVNLIKIIREDGKVEWHEVQTAYIAIIPLVTKWIFPLWRWIRDRMQKRRAKRANR
jgi:hypothetical protein